ncbi:hypothetical protein PLESTF_000022400 [Pleodorina starrii]|nr:hypothetical protein PLESTF_000022400 [Pleodorina starrii]
MTLPKKSPTSTLLSSPASSPRTLSNRSRNPTSAMSYSEMWAAVLPSWLQFHWSNFFSFSSKVLPSKLHMKQAIMATSWETRGEHLESLRHAAPRVGHHGFRKQEGKGPGPSRLA